MARSALFQAMFDLPIGGDLLMPLEAGETPEAALKRLKMRASKYRKKGRSYSLCIEGDAIRVRRVAFGANKKLASLEAMTAGEVIVLHERPTPSDIKSAKNTIAYLNAKPGVVGYWVVERDQSGRLVVICRMDAHYKFDPALQRSAAPSPPTEHEKQTRFAAQCRLIAAFDRKEADRAGSEGARKELLRMAEWNEERARNVEVRDAAPE